jgi:hypothetical protein
MKLNDKVYDVCKWLGLFVFPAIAVFISTVLPVWGVDAGLVKALTVTSNAIGVLIATVIGISQITIANEKAKMITELNESDDADAETEDDIPVTEEEINDEGI